MKPNFEVFSSARDRFLALYKPRVEKLLSRFEVNMIRTGNDYALYALCRFENLSLVSNETKEKIKAILPNEFEYKGEKYRVRVDFRGTAVRIRDLEKKNSHVS